MVEKNLQLLWQI